MAPTNWLVVQGTPSGWGGDERVVLVPLEGSWLVVRGSAFQPDVAFAEDLAPGDGFNVMLDSVDLARLSPTRDGPASRGEGRAVVASSVQHPGRARWASVPFVHDPAP